MHFTHFAVEYIFINTAHKQELHDFQLQIEKFDSFIMILSRHSLHLLMHKLCNDVLSLTQVVNKLLVASVFLVLVPGSEFLVLVPGHTSVSADKSEHTKQIQIS